MEDIVSRRLIGTESNYYKIESVGRLKGSQAKKLITCVYSLRDERIVYWREKEFTDVELD